MRILHPDRHANVWFAVRPDRNCRGREASQMRCEGSRTGRDRSQCVVVTSAHCATNLHRSGAGTQQLREIGVCDGDLKLRDRTSVRQLRRWLVVLRRGEVCLSAAPPIYASTPRRGLRVERPISSLTTFPVGFGGVCTWALQTSDAATSGRRWDGDGAVQRVTRWLTSFAFSRQGIYRKEQR